MSRMTRIPIRYLIKGATHISPRGTPPTAGPADYERQPHTLRYPRRARWGPLDLRACRNDARTSLKVDCGALSPKIVLNGEVAGTQDKLLAARGCGAMRQ